MWDKYPGWSPYVYCRDNPINSFDPDGRESWPVKYYRIRSGGLSGYVGYYKAWRIRPVTSEKYYHKGVDILCPLRTPIYAYASGKVVRVGNFGDAGLMVELVHDNAIAKGSKYMHLSEIVIVDADPQTPGIQVKEGQFIGYTGDSGNAIGEEPHLHFELIENDNKPMDPYEGFSMWDKIIYFLRTGHSIPKTSYEEIKNE